MKSNTPVERLYNGIIKENPTFALMLGMCPTLAVTTSAINGIGMGLSTTAVLVFSNWIIALLRNIIPDRVRIPAFIVIVASLVTVVQLLMQGFVPGLYQALGIYIPLIVVNCIILGRAESYAYKNPAIASFFDGLGMGLGFTFALTCLGILREFIGAGAIFGMQIIPDEYHISIFVLAPGAFFVLAMLAALQNKFKAPCASNTKSTSKMDCGGDCMHCSGSSCSTNHDDIEIHAKKEQEEKLAKIKAAAAAKVATVKAEKTEE